MIDELGRDVRIFQLQATVFDERGTRLTAIINDEITRYWLQETTLEVVNDGGTEIRAGAVFGRLDYFGWSRVDPVSWSSHPHARSITITIAHDRSPHKTPNGRRLSLSLSDL